MATVIGRGLSGAIRQERVRIGRIRANMGTSAISAVHVAAARCVNRLRNQHLSGPTGARSVSVISGRLRASVRAEVTTTSGPSQGAFGAIASASVRFSMGEGLPYGTIHIRGGIIRATKARRVAYAAAKRGAAKAVRKMKSGITLLSISREQQKQLKRGASRDLARIRGWGGPYLVFKTKDGKWHSVKRVKIPARIPFAAVTTEELAKLREDVRAAMQRELAISARAHQAAYGVRYAARTAMSFGPSAASRLPSIPSVGGARISLPPSGSPLADYQEWYERQY